MKIELFVNENWKTADKVFTHYWFNEGENFYDSVEQSFDGFYHYENESVDFVSDYDGYTGPTEAYLEQFKKAGYSWKELAPTKFQRQNIMDATIQIGIEEFNQYPVLFLRVTEEDGFVKYYYSEGTGEVSDQNFPTTYVVPLKLDMWATCWIWMHHFMKSNTDDIDFIQKMCNRFIFNDPVYEWDESEQKYLRKQSTGFVIDYLRQPYLMRSANYETQLFVNDTRENFLTLEEFLFINSGKRDRMSYETWLSDYWINWMKNPYVGTFNPKEKTTTGTETVTITDGIGKYQNKYAEKLIEGFYDTYYNSNTKYRYLVCKVGNNTLPSKQTAGKPAGMFTNFEYDTNFISGGGKISVNAISTEEWTPYLYTYITKKPFGWYKELDMGDVSLGDDAVCVAWTDWLIANKYLTLKFTDNDTDVFYVTWTDNLQLKEHRVILNAYEIGKEYPIIDLPAKSYAFDIYGDTIDVNLSISIRFDSKTKATLVLRTWFDVNFIDVFDHNLIVQNNETSIVNDIYVAQGGTIIDGGVGHINGETLMIIPFKKGEWERKYIELLNSTDYGINMGDGSVLGMPVNDIPPSVLALAMRRQNDESDWQTIGDVLSVRNVPSTSGNIPVAVDLVNLNINDNQIPVLFTDFSHTPITIATAPLPEDIYQCVGGNNFFNDYYQILSKSYLTGNIYQLNHATGLWECTLGGNTMLAEPFIRGPQFWKWAYYIDGTHAIELTGDRIDFKKLITDQNWEVKLNVSLNGASNYFLDISQIKNSKFPMSKLGMEYISGDPSSYPWTTEAYNNWIQTNQSTQDTARNAKDIKNEYAWKRGIVDATVGAAEAGASAAASAKSGGLFNRLSTAANKALTFTAVAGAHAAGAIAGTTLTVEETNKQFENEWAGKLANYYNSPSHLNPQGFSTGSVIYSPIAASNQNSYELFRTFSAPDILREKVWHDISINGYPFVSQCAYADYNNRLMFNIVNCNLYDKQYTFANYLKEKMFTINPIFATTEMINSFIQKCQNKFRVFKCIYNESNMNNIIAQNIELEREWCDPYFAAQQNITVDIKHEVKDSQYEDESWVWTDEYHWTNPSEGTYILQKTKDSAGYTEYIKYDSLGVNNFTEFKNAYSDVYLGNKNSNALMFERNIWDKTWKPVQESVATNSADYGPFGIKLSRETSKNINVINSNAKLDAAVEVKLNNVIYHSKHYELGWKVSLEDGDSQGLKITLIPISQWTFNESVDLTTGVIENATTEGSIGEVKIDQIVEPKLPFNKKEESLDNMYPIYRDSRWFNNFPIYSGGYTITYYDLSGSNYKGAVISGHKDTNKKSYSYDKLGFDFIKTKADFRKYFKQISFNASGAINYKMRWPKEESEKWLTGERVIILDIPQTTDSLTKTAGIQIGMDVFGRSDLPQYHVDTILNERIDNNIAGCFAGQASRGWDIRWGRARSNANYGTLFEIITLTMTLYEDHFVLKEESQLFYNGYGTHNDTGWMSNYGQVLKDGFEHQASKLYFSISRDNNLEKLYCESKISDVKLIGGTGETSRTKWGMDNIINYIMFVKKPEEM